MESFPLASEPFSAPTHRDMFPSERRKFARTHRTCIYGSARRADGPAMSVVCYIPTDTDELLISTMRGRAKAKAVRRDEKIRPVVEAMAKIEDRVVVRCRPYVTFAQPPRHLYRNDQEEEITDWIASSMPWDAQDEGPA